MKRFKQVFLALGYRDIGEGAWAKPAGYGVFSIVDFKICYRFRAFNRKDVLVWNCEDIYPDRTIDISDEQIADSIMQFENYEFHKGSFHDSGFGFLTKDQQAQLYCDL
jgi:hypothetical protein